MLNKEKTFPTRRPRCQRKSKEVAGEEEKKRIAINFTGREENEEEEEGEKGEKIPDGEKSFFFQHHGKCNCNS